jgi:hypothetical protein
MKLTNKFNLPETIVNVLKRPTYSKGKAHISATGLLKSPRIFQLEIQHQDEIEQDASEMVWSLFGTAIHGVLEHGKDQHHTVEERLHAEFEGWQISGAIDLQRNYDDGVIISDYKTTGAWSVMNEKKDWEYQLNIYAWLVEKVKGSNIKGLEIVAIIRDWSRRDAANKEGYPEAPIKTIQIPLWSYEQREDFILDKIKLHSDAQFARETGEELPLCTPEQMWEKPTVWAVKKEGGVRAKSVWNTEEEAHAALSQGDVIEVRPGQRTRCESFCSVRNFCNQWKEFNQGRDNNGDL